MSDEIENLEHMHCVICDMQDTLLADLPRSYKANPDTLIALGQLLGGFAHVRAMLGRDIRERRQTHPDGGRDAPR